MCSGPFDDPEDDYGYANEDELGYPEEEERDDWPIGQLILGDDDLDFQDSDFDFDDDLAWDDGFDICPEFDETFQDIIEMDVYPDSDLGNCW